MDSNPPSSNPFRVISIALGGPQQPNPNQGGRRVMSGMIDMRRYLPGGADYMSEDDFDVQPDPKTNADDRTSGRTSRSRGDDDVDSRSKRKRDDRVTQFVGSSVRGRSGHGSGCRDSSGGRDSSSDRDIGGRGSSGGSHPKHQRRNVNSTMESQDHCEFTGREKKQDVDDKDDSEDDDESSSSSELTSLSDSEQSQHQRRKRKRRSRENDRVHSSKKRDGRGTQLGGSKKQQDDDGYGEGCGYYDDDDAGGFGDGYDDDHADGFGDGYDDDADDEEEVGKRNRRKQKHPNDNWGHEVGKRNSRKQKRPDENRGHGGMISRSVTPQRKKTKTNNAGIARNIGGKKKKTDKRESGQYDEVNEFDVQNLKRKYTILEGTDANVWDDPVAQAESMKVIDYERLRQLGDLSLPKNVKKLKGRICGKVSQAFLAPPSDIYPGYLMGTLVLPPHATKFPEEVGGCAQTFTVVSCQPKALEVSFADPDELDGEFHQKTAQRFVLSSGDIFRVPPGNAYQIVNHSESVNAKLTWTIIRPMEDLGMDEDSE